MPKQEPDAREPPIGRWMKPPRVAEYMGVPEKRVRDWIRNGDLPAIREDGRWYLKREWVERFAEEREREALALQRRELMKQGIRRGA